MAEDFILTTQGPRGLLPVPKDKTYTARDGNVKQKLAYDVSAFTYNEVRKLMVLIAEEETAEQIRIDNPPAFVNVDNQRGKSILEARRRITISFGSRLKVAALASLKAGLVKAISTATVRHSGALSNPANWTFRYVRNGRVSPLPLVGSEGVPMGPADFIVLMPSGVTNQKGQAYATAANMRVAGSGKLSFRRSAKQKRIRRADQSIGFLALAARAAQASAAFEGFTVSAGFTHKYALPGEVTRLGSVRTGYIKIRPKVGRGGRRRG